MNRKVAILIYKSRWTTFQVAMDKLSRAWEITTEIAISIHRDKKARRTNDPSLRVEYRPRPS